MPDSDEFDAFYRGPTQRVLRCARYLVCPEVDGFHARRFTAD